MARLVAPRPLSCHDGAFNKIRNIDIEKPKKVRTIKKVRSKLLEMDDVFVMADLESTPQTDEPRVRLRRRKSLPTMRRKTTDSYQTLPLPRKSKSTKSESNVISDDMALSPRKTIIETMGTLGRKGSIRKAKV